MSTAGDTEGGPFARLTDSPISGAGTTDAPTSYEFADDTIDPDARLLVLRREHLDEQQAGEVHPYLLRQA